MSLSEGQRLGPYELLAPIGAGGMGEVWRARDANLGREVAVKVLPPALAQDQERIARFQREAKLLASLDHPNIAVIHGFDHVDGIHFLAMELVEGETLAERLKRGGPALEDTLDIARQVAEALEAAHDKGVIHRDLKPGNVMLRPDGSVKVLDFGLAKEMPSLPPGGPDARSPTITVDFTTPGVVLGTAAYMSPEQARGRPLDKRTDIWSFGVILFECLTGDRLFGGDTAVDSMGAIMHKEPEWSRLPPGTPPTIQLLLRRCLTKARKRRLHDIADARVEIEEAIDDPSSSALGLASVAVADKARAGSRRIGLPAVIAAFVLGAAIVAGVAISLRPAPEPKTLRRFEFAQDIKPRQATISPDGKIIAYQHDGAVYLRELDAIEARLLWKPEKGDRISELFWSPDSLWLGIQAGSEFWRVSITGSQAFEVADQPMTIGPAWSDDGYFYLCNFKDGSLQRIPARGGAVETILEKTEAEVHFHPGSPLPGGRGVMFLPHLTDSERSVLSLLTPDGERRVLFEDDQLIGKPHYSSTGHILYFKDKPRGVWALPFSLSDLSVTGEPFLVLADQRNVSVSDAGDLVYSKGDGMSTRGSRLVWVDRSGEVQREVGPVLFQARGVALSHDGRRAAVSTIGPDEDATETEEDIWIVDLQRELATRLAAEEDQQGDPEWSPDDRRIAYMTFRGLDDVLIQVRSTDGSGDAETLVDDAYAASMNDDWSTVAIMTGSIANDTWIATQQIGDDASRREFQNGDAYDVEPVLRPGGGLIAYISGNIMAGEAFLFLRPFPEGEGRWQLSTKSAEGVRWNRAGDRLYFVEGDGEDRILMEVAVTVDGSSIELGDATPLFAMEENRFAGFDLSPDGRSFLMLQKLPEPESGAGDEGIVVVQNWFEDFRSTAK